MRIYLDTAPVIYIVEQVPRFAAAVEARLSDPGDILITSDLTRLECRVQPIHRGNLALLKDFDDYFDQAIAQIVELSRDIIDAATAIPAQYGFKTPDAIHLAAAMAAGCDVFLTNDRRLERFEDLKIEILQLS